MPLASAPTAAVPRAGNWDLVAMLDGVLIKDGSQSVAVTCPIGEFENAGLCQVCLGGALCEAPGLALATLPLRAGRWRARTRPPPRRFCVGGLERIRNVASSNDGSPGHIAISTSLAVRMLWSCRGVDALGLESVFATHHAPTPHNYL